MPNDLRGELSRPLPIALALLAAVGWIAAISLGISRASVERNLTAEITRTEAARAEAVQQLEAQRAATGQLSEVQNRISFADAEVAELTARRNAVQAELAAGESRLGELQRQTSNANLSSLLSRAGRKS